VKRPDFDREDNTVNESIDDIQRALDEDDDEELGGPTVLSSGEELDAPTPMPQQPRATPVPVRPTPQPMAVRPTPNPMAAPMRPTPNPVAAPVRPTPNPTARPSSIMTSAPVRPTPMPAQRTTPPPMQPQMQHAPRQTPPYGVQVARGTPAHVPAPMPPSPFEESSMGGYSDQFSGSFTEDDAATQLASAAYDDHVAQSLYANTPRPGAPSHPPYAQQPMYEQQQAFEPPSRPSMRHHTPVPQAADSPDVQARLARLQGLSLERPAVASAPSSSSRGGSKLPWVLLALVIIGGGAYHFYTVSKAEKNNDAKAAPIVPPTTGPSVTPSASTLLASGYIAAKAPITISATMSGRLQDVKVEAGDTITKGQVLALVADGNIRAELALAGAKVRDASRKRSRLAMLVKAQAATPADLDAAQGSVDVARGEYHVIEQKLEDTRIKSPINGTVLEVLAHPGESLTPGPNGATGGILKIADLSALIAEVDVAEAELKNVTVNQEAELSSEAQRGHTYKGVVREIAEQADRARGTVLVKVDIVGEIAQPSDEAPAPEGSGSGSGSAAPPKAPDPKKDKPVATGLRPGMAVQVRFIVKKTL
jgi:HlyD family secretion protein